MSRKRKLRKLEVQAAVKASPRGDGSMVLTSAQRWVRWLAPLLVALITCAAFLPTLQNQFVSWDDDKNFLENPHYRGLSWTHLHWMWTTHLGHYIPLTWMTLGLDYLLWGMNPVGYHLTSLLLHVTNAVVFFFVVRRLLTRALPSPSERGYALAVSAGVAALVFAIHPLRVESVAWVTERRDVLSGLFYLVAILLYLRACEGMARGRGWYWLSVAVFVCALLSKSMVVNLPIVLLILDVYPLRRLGGFVGWWSGPARRVYVEKIPFVFLAAAASAVALIAQLSVHTVTSLAQLSVPGRLAVSAYGLSFYLWKTVAPVNLSPLYELPPTVNPWAPPFLLSYGLVVAITALVLAFRRPLPGLLAAWVAYVVVLLPVLGIFQSGPQIAADRYTYLASLGWAILVSAGVLSHWRRRPFLFTGLAACVLFGLGILTWNQVQVWRDSEKLWTHALATYPKSSIAENNWANVLAEQGKLGEASEQYRRAVQIRPDDADAHNNLGNALAQQGKLSEAVDHYRQALKIKPDFAKAASNLGSALAQQGKLSEAVEHYRRALKIKPGFAEAPNDLGHALARPGHLARAIDHYRQALKIKPDFAKTASNMGPTLPQKGQPNQGVEE